MRNIQVKPILHTYNKAEDVKHEYGTPVEIETEYSPSEIAKEIIVFLKDSSGKEFMFKSRTVTYQDKTFISPFPNPVHLFLKTSIESFNQSVNTLALMQNDCQLDDLSRKISILNINENFTNNNYNDFVRFRITSIISLVAAIETFLNQIIPNNFIYNQARKLGEITELDKTKIESSKVYFIEKLTSVISQFLTNTKFENDNAELIETITEMYSVRKNIIHLKTNSEDEIAIYFSAIGKVLELDIEKSIEATIKYMNVVELDFIK